MCCMITTSDVFTFTPLDRYRYGLFAVSSTGYGGVVQKGRSLKRSYSIQPKAAGERTLKPRPAPLSAPKAHTLCTKLLFKQKWEV